MSDLFPRLSGVGMRRDWFPPPDIDRDVPRIHTLLDLAHPRVLASAAEQAWGLNSEVTNLMGVMLQYRFSYIIERN